MDKRSLYDLTFVQLSEWIASIGEPKYRTQQIFEWLYEKDASDVQAMTNLSAALRERIGREWTTLLPETIDVVSAEDGTEKLLLQLPGAEHKIESVLMPSDDRMTICVSSQVGCALDCKFCATATMGFKRNLTPSEIVGQVIIAKRRLAEKNRRLSNIVFMGMGEPLLNFDNLCAALSILTGKEAMGMSPSRITVSTAGVADRVLELFEKFPVNIAVSLNGSNEQMRTKLMPRVSKLHAIDELLAAAKKLGQNMRKPLTFEYVLMHGVSDTSEQAKELVRRVSGIRCKINLIPFNPFPGSEFKRPEPEQVMAFQKILWDSDVPAYIRWSQGLDVAAACGQLAVRAKK